MARQAAGIYSIPSACPVPLKTDSTFLGRQKRKPPGREDLRAFAPLGASDSAVQAEADDDPEGRNPDPDENAFLHRPATHVDRPGDRNRIVSSFGFPTAYFNGHIPLSELRTEYKLSATVSHPTNSFLQRQPRAAVVAEEVAGYLTEKNSSLSSFLFLTRPDDEGGMEKPRKGVGAQSVRPLACSGDAPRSPLVKVT